MSELIKGFKEIVGAENVVDDPSVLREFTVDWIGIRRLQQFKDEYEYNAVVPLAIVKVHSAEEVSKALLFATEQKVNVITSAGRSCVTAGLEVTENTILLDTSPMNEIVKFDSVNYLVTVQPGTPLEYLEGYCNLRGYSTGHFPQSLPLAQMGGLVATRSTGQLSSYYGGIEDMLVGIEVVLPTGEIIYIKNNPRRSTGPDLRHIFLGSEGALGVITEITVRLFKLPADTWQNAYAVNDMDEGLEAIREIMQAGWRPAVVRLHDEYEAHESYSKFVSEDECVLFFLVHGPKGEAQLTGEAIHEICAENYGFRTIGPKLVDRWLETRNNVCYNMQRHAKAGNVGETIDVSALWSDIGEIYKVARARGLEEIRDIVQFSAHSSHSYMQGTNMYFVVRFKDSDDYEDNRARFDQAYNIVMEETLKRNGSITHHHGVGKYRVKWMPEDHGTSFTVMEKLKEALDPNGIMNYGVLIPAKD